MDEKEALEKIAKRVIKLTETQNAMVRDRELLVKYIKKTMIFQLQINERQKILKEKLEELASGYHSLSKLVVLLTRFVGNVHLEEGWDVSHEEIGDTLREIAERLEKSG